MRKSAAAYLVLGLLTTSAAAGVIILSRDPSLSARAPNDAWDGPGCWADSERYFMTGHSTSLDSLGEAKGERYERDFAEQDAKRFLALKIAQEKDPQFTEDSYDLDVELAGFQTVATYRLDGRDGLFLIGTVKKDDAVVHASYNPEKTRTRACAAFKVGDFGRAARLCAVTHRDHNAADFRNEIQRRWPPDAP